MSLSHTVWEQVDAVDAAAWDAICGADDIFMDRRFIRAVETSMGSECRFWHVIVRDETSAPVACASFASMPVDLALLAGGNVARLIGSLRRVFPSFMRLTVLLAGLPVAAAQKNVAFAPVADHSAVLQLLDRLSVDLARCANAQLIVFKEFSDRDLPALDRLIALGYRRAESPPVYYLEQQFSDLDQYCAALRGHYRWEIKQSRKKFGAAGFSVQRISGPDQIAAFYTPEVHRLYQGVFDRSENKLELLPPEFFRDLGKALPEETTFTVISKGTAVVAFMCALTAKSTYHFLFCGFDYAINQGNELYFNLMYQELDHGLRSGRPAIEVGQTADFFKSRLGCSAHPRYFYLKALGMWWAMLLKLSVPVLFPKPNPAPRLKVFRDGTEASS